MRRRATQNVAAAYDEQAERALLGACLLKRDACAVLRDEVDPGDFYMLIHQRIAQAVLELSRLGSGVDAVTVGSWLEQHPEGPLDRKELGRLLLALMAEVPATGNASAYAAAVRERANWRRLRTVLAELSQEADQGDLSAEALAELMQSKARLVQPVAELEDASIDRFLAREVQYRWVVERLLERGDRLILTGKEGYGKSTLLRQLAVQFSAGIHPFQPLRVPPVRVLMVDLENSELQVHRKLRPLYQRVAQPQLRFDGASYDPSFLQVRIRPGGLDLLHRPDRQWFTAAVKSARPDVLITGPIYKLARGNPSDEEFAQQVAGYLDDLRTEYDCAVLLEAHSPHSLRPDGGRELRPYGASLWMRWPEFGYGLVTDRQDGRIVNWESWRPPRDPERDWPSRLTYGNSWPWVNANLEEPL